MSANIAKTGPETVIRESLPVIAILVSVLFLVTYVPSLALWLVNIFFAN